MTKNSSHSEVEIFQTVDINSATWCAPEILEDSVLFIYSEKFNKLYMYVKHITEHTWNSNPSTQPGHSKGILMVQNEVRNTSQMFVQKCLISRNSHSKRNEIHTIKWILNFIITSFSNIGYDEGFNNFLVK